MANDRPEFEYYCDRNHYMAGPVEQTKCLAVVKGVPCPGVLKRVGNGSRKAKSGV